MAARSPCHYPRDAVLNQNPEHSSDRGAGRHVRSGFALFVLLTLLTVLTLLPVTRAATEAQLESAAGRALAAFAVARALNAVISVVQETEVGFSLGVNITAEPGQVLDPLNDLVERFSLVALTAAAVLGALRLATELFAWPAVPMAMWLWLVLVLAAGQPPPGR